MARKNANGLTDQQQEFAHRYANDPEKNAAAAYRAAYPRIKSEAAARTNASKLLTNANVQRYVDQEIQRLMDRLDVTKERVLREAARMAFFDIGQLYDEQGNMRALHTLDADTRRAIASVQTVVLGEDEGTGKPLMLKSVKLADKNKAIDTLMKHLGLYAKDNKQKQTDIATILRSIDGGSTGLPSPPPDET